MTGLADSGRGNGELVRLLRLQRQCLRLLHAQRRIARVLLLLRLRLMWLLLLLEWSLASGADLHPLSLLLRVRCRRVLECVRVRVRLLLLADRVGGHGHGDGHVNRLAGRVERLA